MRSLACPAVDAAPVQTTDARALHSRAAAFSAPSPGQSRRGQTMQRSPAAAANKEASRCVQITHEMALHEVHAYPHVARLDRQSRVLQQHSVSPSQVTKQHLPAVWERGLVSH